MSNREQQIQELIDYKRNSLMETCPSSVFVMGDLEQNYREFLDPLSDEEVDVQHFAMLGDDSDLGVFRFAINFGGIEKFREITRRLRMKADAAILRELQIIQQASEKN